MTQTKRVLIGRPLATSESDHQRLPKTIALATFSSDAISSTAYATEEILFVTAAGASSLALGLSRLVPLAIVVAALLVIVSVSYRQTIFSYPSGGGSYIVSRENLGETPSLVAGASLLVDYILTVAVSISSGVAAILSIPTFHSLEHLRVPMCLGLVAVVTLANLRGVKESGRAFAVPTYVYIVSITTMVVFGLWKVFFGHYHQVPFDPHRAHGVAQAGGSLTLFLLLRGFSSGAVALTGVEAISNGVPAFQRPESRNAATTLTWMAAVLGSLFLGLSVLASRLHPFPTHAETVNSQMARVLFGESPFYWIIQLSTCAILVLAANTAFADFPRLSSIIAKDGYLPRQFANLGDRLVFSNGMVFLALAACLLIVMFGGIVTALIPLYAIGVFTSFTLSQTGMVRHHLRHRQAGWRRSIVINAVGAVATCVVMLIVAITKFTQGRLGAHRGRAPRDHPLQGHQTPLPGRRRRHPDRAGGPPRAAERAHLRGARGPGASQGWPKRCSTPGRSAPTTSWPSTSPRKGSTTPSWSGTGPASASSSRSTSSTRRTGSSRRR